MNTVLFHGSWLWLLKEPLKWLLVGAVVVTVGQSCERSVARISMAAIQCADRLGNSTTTIQLGRPR